MFENAIVHEHFGQLSYIVLHIYDLNQRMISQLFLFYLYMHFIVSRVEFSSNYLGINTSNISTCGYSLLRSQSHQQ